MRNTNFITMYCLPILPKILRKPLVFPILTCSPIFPVRFKTKPTRQTVLKVITSKMFKEHRYRKGNVNAIASFV